MQISCAHICIQLPPPTVLPPLGPRGPPVRPRSLPGATAGRILLTLGSQEQRARRPCACSRSWHDPVHNRPAEPLPCRARTCFAHSFRTGGSEFFLVETPWPATPSSPWLCSLRLWALRWSRTCGSFSGTFLYSRAGSSVGNGPAFGRKPVTGFPRAAGPSPALSGPPQARPGPALRGDKAPGGECRRRSSLSPPHSVLPAVALGQEGTADVMRLQVPGLPQGVAGVTLLLKLCFLPFPRTAGSYFVAETLFHSLSQDGRELLCC